MPDAPGTSVPVLFLDSAIDSNVVADNLIGAGAEVRRFKVVYSHQPDIRDTEWLTEIGARRWFVLTKDKRILDRQNETLALVNANVGAFFFTAGQLKGEIAGRIIASAYPEMLKIMTTIDRPFIFKIDRDGNLERLK